MPSHKKTICDIKKELEIAYNGFPLLSYYFGMRLDELTKKELLLVIQHLYFTIGGGHATKL